MKYLIPILLLFSCSSNIQQLPEPNDIADPYVICIEPSPFEMMDSAFQIKFRCYAFNAPQWQRHYIKCWRLVTDENYELIDTNLTEEWEMVDLKFKKSGGHWVGITAVQDNGKLCNEIIHFNIK